MTTTPPAKSSTPDPRLDREEKPSLEATMLDLDETERHRCIMIARRYERFFRQSDNFSADLLPSLWLFAHDRAITEIAAARASATMNSSAEWDEHTWRDPQ